MQLDLFVRKRRHRSKRIPSPPEFQLQVSIADTITRWILPTWKFTHLPFGEARDEITGARLKRMGTKRGWPDLIFVGPGRIFFIELKRRGEKPTTEQEGIGAHIRECGFGYFVFDDYKATIAFLVEQGVLRGIHVQ